ncbi:MAG: hypothetical protein QOG63_633 [Thermoleophilaceae bacterium]|jgi:hypothetical protein|nr:hypothetical protein [Thermoleophilaceae bacterium]
MKRTATTLCISVALAATPAVGYACSNGADGTSASGKASTVTAAGNRKLRKCKKRAYARYQGPDLNRALKKCKRKYG